MTAARISVWVMLSLVLAVAGARSAMADSAVIAAYEAARKAGLLSPISYEVASDGDGGYQTTSPDWGTPMPVVTTASGRYMAIKDEGTGGGTFEVVAVLWTVAPDLEFLIVTGTLFDGGRAENSRLRLYSDTDHGWEEVTGYAWPGVPLHAFMPGSMTIADLQALEEIGASVYLQLAEADGYPVAWLVINREPVSAVCNGEDWFVPRDPSAYLRFCDRIDGNIRTQLALHWDPNAYGYRIDRSD